ncbi:hypothetical protein [Desulfatitalea tepidiphila]|uniref:hypothetical protein n=1 Tax=Desulfatitalea tepidiphila TaxID=1185843 RepID=UPI0006B59FE5|nr:hypothetical protein [Desulfatitalea tepidiphila]
MRAIERKIFQLEQIARPGEDTAAAKAMAELTIALMKESLRENPDHPCQEAMAEQKAIIKAIESGNYRQKTYQFFMDRDERAASVVAELRDVLAQEPAQTEF